MSIIIDISRCYSHSWFGNFQQFESTRFVNTNRISHRFILEFFRSRSRKIFAIKMSFFYYSNQNVEIKHLIVFGLMKLFLSSRLEPSIDLLKLILDYRFSNKHRFITEHQREQITVFFYFFTHQSMFVKKIFNLTSFSSVFIIDPMFF